MAAVAGAGSYTFAAFALSAANFWIHVLSTIYTVLRKKGSFVVTPKKGAEARQPGAVMPALVAVGVLAAACVYGLVHNPDAATINNVSFAAVHISILMTGCWAALQKPPRSGRRDVRAGRGVGLSRPVRDVAWSLAGAGRDRAVAAHAAAARVGLASELITVRLRGSGSGAGVAAAEHFLDPYVNPDGRVVADRPGRRYGRRGTGLRDVAGGRDRRLAPLRHDLDVDEEQSPPPRRADLVPVARRARGGSTGGVRRRPRRQPRAAGRGLPLPPPRAATGGDSAGERDHAGGGRLRSRAPRC